MSDIPTDPVSHNDPISDMPPRAIDLLMQGYGEGFDEGRAVGRTEVAVFHADLIAELRELATCDIDLGNQTDPETLAFLLDRAEARLREVGDE